MTTFQSKSIRATIRCTFVAAALSIGLADRPALSTPIIDYNGNAASHRSDGPYTIGTLFQTGPSKLTVFHLGAQDDGPSGPDGNGFFVGSVNVGLWDATGTTLLSSVTVLSSDPLTGTYRYHALTTPITLTANTQYLIGAAVGGGIEWFEDSQPNPAPFVGDLVTIVQNRFENGGTLAPPVNNGLGVLGRWGAANALAQIVPEPSSLVLLAFGSAGLWLAKRKRSRTIAVQLLLTMFGVGFIPAAASAAIMTPGTKIGWDVQAGGDGNTVLTFPGLILSANSTWNFTDSDMAAGTIVNSTGTVITGVGTARFGSTWSNWGTVVYAPESNLVTQDYLFDTNANDVDGHNSRLDITGLDPTLPYRLVVHANRIQSASGGTTDGGIVTVGTSSVVLPAGTGMNAAWPDGGFAVDMTSAEFPLLFVDGSGTIKIYFDKISVGAAVILTGFELEALPVPEPSTGALGLLGLAGLMLRRRRTA